MKNPQRRKTDSRLLKRILPDKENMKLPFDLARKLTSIDSAAQIAMSHGMNYCLFMMCLHVLRNSVILSWTE